MRYRVRQINMEQGVSVMIAQDKTELSLLWLDFMEREHNAHDYFEVEVIGGVPAVSPTGLDTLVINLAI